jgi:hypothetical protein
LVVVHDHVAAVGAMQVPALLHGGCHPCHVLSSIVSCCAPIVSVGTVISGRSLMRSQAINVPRKPSSLGPCIGT